ncbi:hypothetical protein IW150_001561 [Coemansia sp. RSA 2607]|nr:hypothetical protein IW150_001561 [Coemansia sp. RSA 2607]KAJ2397740.1 hypothetical protein GGI05_000486 [Coemansia sp. RSA 2603]
MLYLDNLQTHHTQALVNITSSYLHQDPIDTPALTKSLIELRRHLESPLRCTHRHPATETNAVEVLEHILLCWVCARAAQTDAQNYSVDKTVSTADGLYDKYAKIQICAVSEVVQCTSYLATASVGIAAVAKTSIPSSLTLSLGFVDDHNMLTNTFRALTKLCTKHSVRRPKAGGRWESETGIYSVLDAFTRAKSALGLRNRFDTLANAAFAFVIEMEPTINRLPSPSLSESNRSIGSLRSTSSLSTYSQSSYLSYQPGSLAERVVTSALVLVNALVEAHANSEARLRLRKELLDTALYKCMKLLEEPEFEHTRAFRETRVFRRAYACDIKECDPQTSAVND